ncbi:MAG: hypothetical protein H8D67_18910 [Deltaproteobacteria bacterium]|nr:hypothetical protein [Deltaproteobacteria bacterium]
MAEIKKTSKMLKIEIQFGEPIEELLCRMYLDEELSSCEIVKQLGTSPTTILDWCRRCGIPIRNESDAVKVKYKNPEYRHKIAEQNREITARPEVQKRISDSVKNLWENPEYHQKMSAINKQKAQTNEARAKRSEISKRNWQDPQKRAAMTSGIRKAKDKQSQAMKEYWGNPEWRTRMIAKIQSACTTAEFRQKMSHISQKKWESPQYREKISQAVSKQMYKRWESPRYRKQQYERMKEIWGNDAPNTPEFIILQLTPSNVQFTGDGTFWRRLPNGQSTNPDFIVKPVKKTRKVIYHHGIYWHRNELHNRGQDLIDQWKQIGFDCLIIWEDELHKDPEGVLNKINDFLCLNGTWQMSLF